MKRKRHYSEHEKIKIVKELEEGEENISTSSIKYNIGKAALGTWIRIYSKSPNKLIQPRYKRKEQLEIVGEVLNQGRNKYQVCKEYRINIRTLEKWIDQYSCGEKQEEMAINKSNKENELQEELRIAKMKIASLELMVDIAEREYKLEIRKKYGTK